MSLAFLCSTFQQNNWKLHFSFPLFSLAKPLFSTLGYFIPPSPLRNLNHQCQLIFVHAPLSKIFAGYSVWAEISLELSFFCQQCWIRIDLLFSRTRNVLFVIREPWAFRFEDRHLSIFRDEKSFMRGLDCYNMFLCAGWVVTRSRVFIFVPYFSRGWLIKRSWGHPSFLLMNMRLIVSWIMVDIPGPGPEDGCYELIWFLKTKAIFFFIVSTIIRIF